MRTSTLTAAMLLALAWLPPYAGAAEDTPQSLQKKCDARDWEACNSLGERYEYGEGVKEDKARATALYARACDAGYASSCTNQAGLKRGDEPMAPASAGAIELYRRGCQLGDGPGCYQLGLINLKGQGVPVNVARGIELIDMGCQLLDGDACFELYMLYNSGKTVPKDAVKAEAYYQKSCDLYALFCVTFFDQKLNPLLVECEEGDAAACYQVGNFHLYGDAYLKVDETKASEYLLKACTGGHGDACGNLGWIYDHGKQVPADRKKAAGYYQKACTNKSAYGCQQLGVLHLKGEGVAKDLRRGAELLRTACNANIADTVDACALLAELYDEGSGVAKDPARAALLRAQACRLGDKPSCAAAAASPATVARPKPAVAAASAPDPASTGCSVVNVQLGKHTAANVESDIKRRGGTANPGTNNGRPTLNVLSGEYKEVGDAFIAAGYTFDAGGTSGRLVGVTLTTHANSNAEFEKLLAARKAAMAAASAQCSTRLVPNADNWFIYEFYELKAPAN